MNAEIRNMTCHQISLVCVRYLVEKVAEQFWMPCDVVGRQLCRLWRMEHDAIMFTCVKPELNWRCLTYAVKCRTCHGLGFKESAFSVVNTECLVDETIEFVCEKDCAKHANFIIDHEIVQTVDFETVDEISECIYKIITNEFEKVRELLAKLEKIAKINELKKEGYADV